MFDILILLALIGLVWLAAEIRSSERLVGRLYRSNNIDFTVDQYKLGARNGPMHGVLLDRGIAATKLKDGKFRIAATAKYSSELYR